MGTSSELGRMPVNLVKVKFLQTMNRLILTLRGLMLTGSHNNRYSNNYYSSLSVPQQTIHVINFCILFAGA